MKRLAILVILVVLIFAVGGCASGPRRGNGFSSASPAERVKAIARAARSGNRRSVPLIVDRLEDEDKAVRMAAIAALSEMTGEDMGYRAFDGLAERNAAIGRWRRWLDGGRMGTSKTTTSRSTD